MILLNGIDHFQYPWYVPPAGDFLLVAEDAPERAGELRDEDRDGVMPGFQSGFLITCFPLRKVRNIFNEMLRFKIARG